MLFNVKSYGPSRKEINKNIGFYHVQRSLRVKKVKNQRNAESKPTGWEDEDFLQEKEGLDSVPLGSMASGPHD